MARRALLATIVLLAACGGDQKVGVYNSPPVVSISSPPDNSSFDEGVVIDFQGLVSDSPTASPDLVLQWSSDIDGVLSDDDRADAGGVVLYSTASLSIGNHAITLAATDEAGERTEYTVGITIVDVPDNPEISVVHPASGESGVEGEAFEFVVQVSDEQQAPDTLTVTFESDVDGTFCQPTPDRIGVAACEQVLSPGDHRLRLSVADADGLRASEEVYFTVVAGTAIDDDGDGWTEAQGDCNDGDASVHPNADEYYNGRDDDCDGLLDDGTVGYDDDADGQNEIDGDCDDADPSILLGGTEACDSKDNDCDLTVDETTNCYDDDGDGLAELAGDCDDGSAISYPGAVELEDGKDNDCDGTVDEGTNAFDDDYDGYSENAGDCNDAVASISPAGTETCNGYDDDCDGSLDEQNASGCSNYYYDYDGDGYGSSSVSGKCLCNVSGYYTSGYDNDCYDYNASASPAQTAYQSSHRGDGSYDWNCDGSQTKYYTSTGGCGGWPTCSTSTGWSSGVASCGTSAAWVYDCDTDWTSCSKDTTTYTQYCL